MTGMSTQSAIRPALAAISVMVSRPTSGRPISAADVPNPVMYTAGNPASSTSRAASGSNAPGATMVCPDSSSALSRAAPPGRRVSLPVTGCPRPAGSSAPRASFPGQARSNSPSWTPRVNASHSAGVKISTGPSGRLLSRMAITWPEPSFEPGTTAISTQAPPIPLLKDDLRQTALVRSISRSPSLPDRWRPAGMSRPPSVWRTGAGSGLGVQHRVAGRGADGGRLRAVPADVGGVDLAPALLPGPGRGLAGQRVGESVEAGVPAGPGPRGRAPLLDGVGEGEEGAVAVGRQLEPQDVRPPPHLERPGRVVDEQLAAEARLRHEVADKPQPGTGHPVTVGLDPLREPGVAVLGLGQGAPHLLPRVGQPALKTDLPPAAGFAEPPVGLVIDMHFHGIALLWSTGITAGHRRRAWHRDAAPGHRGWWPTADGTARATRRWPAAARDAAGTGGAGRPSGRSPGRRRAAPAGASTPPAGSGRARRQAPPRCAPSHAAGRGSSAGAPPPARRTVQPS